MSHITRRRELRRCDRFHAATVANVPDVAVSRQDNLRPERTGPSPPATVVWKPLGLSVSTAPAPGSVAASAVRESAANQASTSGDKHNFGEAAVVQPTRCRSPEGGASCD